MFPKVFIVAFFGFLICTTSFATDRTLNEEECRIKFKCDAYNTFVEETFDRLDQYVETLAGNITGCRNGGERP